MEQSSEKASFVSGGVKLEEPSSGFRKKQNLFSWKTQFIQNLSGAQWGRNAQHVENYLEQQNPIKVTHFFDSPVGFFETMGFLKVNPWGLPNPLIVSGISLIVKSCRRAL